jgi:hypothetical protein
MVILPENHRVARQFQAIRIEPEMFAKSAEIANFRRAQVGA